MCAEARGPPELQQIHPVKHPSAEILNHEREHGIPISLTRGIPEEELRAALHYGAQSSSGKEVDFVHHKIDKQVQAFHDVIYPLADVRGLPTLWISPVAIIPQVGRRPCLIFDLTWSGLNDITARKAPEEVMRFRGNLHRIMRKVLMAKPRI